MSDKLPACRGLWQKAPQEVIDWLEACAHYSADGAFLTIAFGYGHA
jgi:hypothetical protein